MVQNQSGQIVHKTLSQKYSSQKGLVEWLKVKALSSSPSTTKKKKTGTSALSSYTEAGTGEPHVPAIHKASA
jgi:hypothetical protein